MVIYTLVSSLAPKIEGHIEDSGLFPPLMKLLGEGGTPK